MHFSYESRSFEGFYKVFLFRKVLRWDAETKERKNRSIFAIDELKKVLMSSTCFIEILVKMRIFWFISLGTYLTSGYILSMKTEFRHSIVGYLAKVGELRSCENLARWDISIHSIEANIFWYHCLKLCHESYKGLIIIGSVSSVFPEFCEF